MTAVTPLGLSLPVDYLSGAPASRESRILQREFRDAGESLARFRALGVSAIELRRITPDTTADVMGRAVDAVRRAGMSITVHGYLPESAARASIEGAYPWLPALLEHARGLQHRIVFTVHAYAASSDGTDELRDDLRKDTIDALRRLARQASGLPIRLVFAVELNREKRLPDPGTTWEGVTLICREVGQASVGICWDWGHGYANALGGFIPMEPSEAFVGRVVHTHVHGVGESGQTHWPLEGGGVPLGRFTSILRAAGYGGLYALELSPARFDGRRPVRPAFEESLASLRDAIGT